MIKTLEFLYAIGKNTKWRWNKREWSGRASKC